MFSRDFHDSGGQFVSESGENQPARKHLDCAGPRVGQEIRGQQIEGRKTETAAANGPPVPKTHQSSEAWHNPSRWRRPPLTIRLAKMADQAEI